MTLLRRRHTAAGDHAEALRAERGDGLDARIPFGGEHLDHPSCLSGDEPLGASRGAHGDPGLGSPMAEEAHNRTQTGVTVLLPNRAGIDHHQIWLAEDDRLVQPSRVVVEEREGTEQPPVERRRQIAVARQAIEQVLGSGRFH